MGYDFRILNDRIMHSRIQYPELEKTPPRINQSKYDFSAGSDLYLLNY